MPFRKISDFNPPLPPCSHPEHNPPSHIVLPPGEWEYECPGCGSKVKISSPSIRWTASSEDPLPYTVIKEV